MPGGLPAHDPDKVVRRVVVAGAWVADGLEVSHGLAQRPAVDGLPLGQQVQVAEKIEYLLCSYKVEIRGWGVLVRLSCGFSSV